MKSENLKLILKILETISYLEEFITKKRKQQILKECNCFSLFLSTNYAHFEIWFN
jgi:hypothetical protein